MNPRTLRPLSRKTSSNATEFVGNSVGWLPCLRHGVATALIDQGTSITAVGAQQRHSDRAPVASVPIRPQNECGFEIPTLEFGNNPGTLKVPFPFLLYLCVPSYSRKSLHFQIKVLCTGNVFDPQLPRSGLMAIARPGRNAVLAGVVKRKEKSLSRPEQR
jgi:hypothetical protein